MERSPFTKELDRLGPDAPRKKAWSLAEAQAYCRRLAKTHYENFLVGSWLLPGELRPHFYNIYAWCRWADDLADETGDPGRSLELLSWWQEMFQDCRRGRAWHPVLVALQGTMETFQMPDQPFLDLLSAFRQDQTKTRYQSFEELLAYCRCSANPVGRLVLHLGRSLNEQTAPLADAICTGLQLANFWQDVARDFRRGRIYLPQDRLEQHQVSLECFEQQRATPEFRQALAAEVDRCQVYLDAGQELVPMVPRWLQVDIELFRQGGLAILGAIRRQRYDVWSHRPTVGKTTQFALFVRAGMRRMFPSVPGPSMNRKTREGSES